MSSTESLRRDHNLIEKMLRALTVTADILGSGKKIPGPILDQTIEFTKNFMLTCHHSKEEDTLFPALEQHGMPREGGPIARMIFEHGISKELAAKMENSARIYQQSGQHVDLVSDIRNYVDHVSAHLTKENLRLFMMADMVLGSKAEQVTSELSKTERSRLSELGKDRAHFEKLVADLETGVVPL